MKLRGYGWIQRACQAGAEQGVYENWRGPRLCEAFDRITPFHARCTGSLRFRIGQRRHAHVQPIIPQQPRGDIAVPAIIARPAKDEDRRSSRKPAHGCSNSPACARHQPFNGRAPGDRRVLGGSHFGRREYRLPREWRHGLSGPVVAGNR
jgi:hypothetical protein